jgi:hypothetical protein
VWKAVAVWIAAKSKARRFTLAGLSCTAKDGNLPLVPELWFVCL